MSTYGNARVSTPAEGIVATGVEVGIIVVSGRSKPQPHELPTGCRFHRKPHDPEIVVRHTRELTALSPGSSLQRWRG
jgi:hypothetical protein